MEHKFRLSYLRLILDIHSFPLLDGLSMIQESEKKKKKKVWFWTHKKPLLSVPMPINEGQVTLGL
jgi:hypothetical protein